MSLQKAATVGAMTMMTTPITGVPPYPLLQLSAVHRGPKKIGKLNK
jgi:hypothetical protein